MRTKKILSVLMAIFIFTGVFGVGAFAEEAEALGEITAQAAGEITAQATAYTGWPSMVEITDEAAYAGAWNRGLIQWIPFKQKTGVRENAAGKDETYTITNSYSEYLEAEQVEMSWKVSTKQWKVDDKGKFVYEADGITHVIKAVVDDVKVDTTPQEAAKKFLAVYTEFTTGANPKVYLHIRQAKDPWYGEVTATLTVSAPSISIDEYTKEERRQSMEEDANIISSNSVTVYIRDSGDFTGKIAKAKKILDKSSRYNGDFIDALGREVAVAEIYAAAYPKDPDKLKDCIAELDRLIKAAPDNMQLTSWKWLNNALSMGFIRFIWKAIDVFSFIGRLFGIIINPLKAIASFFGAILKFFGLITPFFGVFTGLFK